MTAHEAPSGNSHSDPPTRGHVIRNDRFEATVQPLAGGRMLSLRHVDHGEILVPVQDASFDDRNWPKAGAFPLFPFHNRLRDAAFRHEGRLIRLRPNSANGADVMHGPAHRRPWRITDKGPDFVEMALDYRADDEWPFDFTAVQRLQLIADGVSIDLSLTNGGSTTMPGGIGWHPYFRPTPDGLIRSDASSQWEPIGSAGFPERRLRDTGAGTDWIRLDATEHFSEWTKVTARIGHDASITISADPRLNHVVMHRNSSYLCIEPASHVSGAFAALPNVSPETGLCLLAPGENLAGTTRLYVG